MAPRRQWVRACYRGGAVVRPIPIKENDAPSPLAFYSAGLVASDVAYLAGQIASDYRTGVPQEARRSASAGDGSDIREQVGYILKNLGIVADAAGTDLTNVAKANIFLKHIGDLRGLNEAWQQYFGSEGPPRTVSFVGGDGLLVPGTVVEIDLWAGSIGTPLSPSISRSLPGEVNEARQLGSLIHCAGKMALGSDGQLTPRARVRPEFPFYAEPVERQTRDVLEQFRSLFDTWGGRLEDVVWGRVFLRNLHDADLFEEVWQELLPQRPARSVLHSNTLAGQGAQVQIELVAVAPEARNRVRRVDAPCGPPGSASAMVVDDVVLLSSVTAGQAVGAEPYLEHDVTAQTKAIVERLDQALALAGTDAAHLVKTQVFLSDLHLFHRYDRQWKRSLETLPPRTTTQVGSQGFLDPGALVCVDAVAVMP